MARPAIDIRILGDKELSRKLKRFPGKVQTKLVRAELRKSAKRTHQRIVEAVSGGVVGIDTGGLLTGFAGVRVRTRLDRRRAYVAGYVPLPEREPMGIDAKDEWYYPLALEYGTKERKGRGSVTAYRFTRKAVDDHRPAEIAAIATGLGKGIKREWRKRTGR